MSQTQQVLNASIQELTSQTAALSASFVGLTKRVAVTERDLLDPWDSIHSSSRNRTEFSKKLKQHYGGENAVATCMITGLASTDEVLVKCSHIWPYSSHGKGLEKFGLSCDDVHSPLNGLMLLHLIEEAFDAKRVGFQYNKDADTFTFRVIDPSLLNGTAYGQHKFQEFDGTNLRIPEEAKERVVEGRAVFPFRRLLVWHFSHVLQKALDLKWRTVEDLQPYFEATSDDKVTAWLTGKSPEAKWPGQRVVGTMAVRATQAGSSASTCDD